MRRYFNTEGACDPNIHYMVSLTERLGRIKERYVDRGRYFIINRGRQYGKTTTLQALAEYLKKEYFIISMDFQKIGSEEFQNAALFSRAFTKMIERVWNNKNLDNCEGLPDSVKKLANDSKNVSLSELFIQLSELCRKASRPVVLLIDEVDSAANNQVFLDFLAMLRGYYLNRKNEPIFHSVILAGVYDIKNLKLKIRPETDHQYNSPWNIAAKFQISMSFSASQIASMLSEYEADNHTGMDVDSVAKYIFDYTSGYPYLVSAVCKLLDEEITETERFTETDCVWTREGVEKAVSILLKEQTPLFDSMAKQLDTYKGLHHMIEGILYRGRKVPFSLQEKEINLGVMFGFLKEVNGSVAISNRIFEMVLLNMFIAREASSSDAFQYGQREQSLFIRDGKLNMEMVLQKFVTYFTDIYGDNDEKFVEEYGRKFFLLYLKPIINGTGNYYLEAQTRDALRTDVIIDYLGEQFIIELKIWHGNEYNQRGESQLVDYLNYYHIDKGYMLSFNFNKKKKIGVREIRVKGKTIIEAVV